MAGTVAVDANFEFADLGNALMEQADLTRAIFVGAALDQARAVGCNLTGADFFWTELGSFVMEGCTTTGARWPAPAPAAFAPANRKAIDVQVLPLYRTAATPQQRAVYLDVLSGPEQPATPGPSPAGRRDPAIAARR
jgi:hypothetical protein